MSVPAINDSDRLASLERQVASLAADVALLRDMQHRSATVGAATAPGNRAPRVERSTVASADLYERARESVRDAVNGDAIESFVGRYGTLLLAALAILMAVGVLVEVAVSHGFFTPAVRVALGALATLAIGGAGWYFRGRGETRYGDVLLAIALAATDLVAWGAGPQLHVVPPLLALVIVDVVAAGLAMLALHDENEFLFEVAVGGALLAPFVTSDGNGAALPLLSYGALVLVSSCRLVRNVAWDRAFAVLIAGAALYVLAAVALPMDVTWYAPYLVASFGGTCAVGALLTAQDEWRGELSRAFLFAGLLGVPVAWDRGASASTAVAFAVAGVLALVTYAALAVRQGRQRDWVASALMLPVLSLGIAYPAADAYGASVLALAVWGGFALLAWQQERRRGEPDRGGAHLFVGGVFGSLAIVDLLWGSPLPLVAALGAWGVVLAACSADEASPLPLLSVALTLGGASLSAVDQLASRLPYGYTPFITRSSASALCATAALALAGVFIGRSGGGRGRTETVRRWADRSLRVGIPIAFAIVWGRMELAHAFTRDLATFLLILYYAACGLATIHAGRRLGVQRLRVLGLALAIYAALKAMLEVASIEAVALRVGAYGAVGLFLLGAGYLYRVRGDGGEESTPSVVSPAANAS